MSGAPRWSNSAGNYIVLRYKRMRHDYMYAHRKRPASVREGEKIVGEHEVVGREEHDKLRALQVEMERRTGGERALGRIVGSVLYNALVLTIFGITIVLFRPQLYRSYRALTLLALLFAVVLVAAAVGFLAGGALGGGGDSALKGTAEARLVQPASEQQVGSEHSDEERSGQRQRDTCAPVDDLVEPLPDEPVKEPSRPSGPTRAPGPEPTPHVPVRS